MRSFVIAVLCCNLIKLIVVWRSVREIRFFVIVVRVTERRLFELLKRVQNRQYDDQRGTSLNAFKEMPDFLQDNNTTSPLPPNDAASAAGNDSEKCSTDTSDSRVEVCRRDDNVDIQFMEIGRSSRFSLSPSQCLRQTAVFSDDDDSVMPSHDNAEQYFSQSARGGHSSPDFTDPRLMERSVRDLGFDSPALSGPRSGGGSFHGWSLIGNISTAPLINLGLKPLAADDAVFAVPSIPPLRLYRRNGAGQSLSMGFINGDGRNMDSCRNS